MIRLKFMLALSAFLLSFHAFAQYPVSVSNLTCESRINPVGIETEHPRLSWVIKTDERNTRQSAYQVLVSDSPEKLKKNIGNTWDSKAVRSDQ